MSLATAVKSPLGLMAAVVCIIAVLFKFDLIPSTMFQRRVVGGTCQAKVYGLRFGERSGEDICQEKIVARRPSTISQYPSRRSQSSSW